MLLRVLTGRIREPCCFHIFISGRINFNIRKIKRFDFFDISVRFNDELIFQERVFMPKKRQNHVHSFF